jgi:hypothetical protein
LVRWVFEQGRPPVGGTVEKFDLIRSAAENQQSFAQSFGRWANRFPRNISTAAPSTIAEAGRRLGGRIPMGLDAHIGHLCRHTFLRARGAPSAATYTIRLSFS